MQIAQRIMDLAESATLAVSAKAARLRADGIDVIGFGAGQPDFPTPSYIVQAGLGALKAGHTGYVNPASGLLLAKKAVCTKLARDNALTYTPDQVIITSGGKKAWFLALHPQTGRAACRGREVISVVARSFTKKKEDKIRRMWN